MHSTSGQLELLVYTGRSATPAKVHEHNGVGYIEFNKGQDGAVRLELRNNSGFPVFPRVSIDGYSIVTGEMSTGMGQEEISGILPHCGVVHFMSFHNGRPLQLRTRSEREGIGEIVVSCEQAYVPTRGLVNFRFNPCDIPFSEPDNQSPPIVLGRLTIRYGSENELFSEGVPLLPGVQVIPANQRGLVTSGNLSA